LIFKFLNIKALVASIPTVRSPYYNLDNRLMKYYNVSEILQIFRQTGFLLDEFLLIFALKTLFRIGRIMPKNIIKAKY